MWKYTDKGPLPQPHLTPCCGPPKRGRGGHGVGGWGGGIPYGYMSILDIGYWISDCTDVPPTSKKKSINPNKSKTSAKYNCVFHFIAAPNPTQYTKLGK